MPVSGPSLRHRIAGIMEGDGTPASRWVRGFIIALILINVSAVILGSVEPYSSQYEGPFRWFEIFSILIFALEYLVRLWAVAEPGRRLRYACSPLMLIDLVVILTFLLGPLVNMDLRFLRLFQLLKLSRHFTSLHLLGKVLKAEARPMAAAMAIMVVLIVVAASLMHFVERGVQEEQFGDIPSAMWWAAVTLTTVGYGDVAPITPIGQLIAGFVMVIGVGMVALPAGMLASRFSQELHQSEVNSAVKPGDEIVCPHCNNKIGHLQMILEQPQSDQPVSGGSID